MPAMTTPEPGLAGRVAIVTGAGRGIGLACVRALHDAGARVVGADREVDALARLADERDGVQALRLDLTEPDAPDALVRCAVDTYGRLDVVVNNLADIGEERPFHEIDDETWDHGLAVNLLATVRTCRAAIPHLVRAGRGAVVTVGSDAGELPAPGFAPYSVAKAALMNLSTLLSKGYGRHGVRSNLVAPGLTRTHATEDLLRGLADEHGSEAAGVVALSRDLGMALPRVGEADEVAALVVYLAGDLAAQVTGAVVRIDGGAVPTM